MKVPPPFNSLGVYSLASCLAKLGSFAFVTLISISAFAGAPTCKDVYAYKAKYQRPHKALNRILQDPSYKVLILGRHGKASGEGKFTADERLQDPKKVEQDILRPLTKEGRRAADSVAELLGDLKFRAVGIWGSFARRVQETAKPIRKKLGSKVKVVEFSEELYYADVPTQMQRRLDTDFGATIQHAFFWGHGKTTLELFKKLTGTTEAFLPTGGFLIVAVKADTWREVFNGTSSTVEAFAWSPKDSHTIDGGDISVSTFE